MKSVKISKFFSKLTPKCVLSAVLQRSSWLRTIKYVNAPTPHRDPWSEIRAKIEECIFISISDQHQSSERRYRSTSRLGQPSRSKWWGPFGWGVPSSAFMWLLGLSLASRGSDWKRDIRQNWVGVQVIQWMHSLKVGRCDQYFKRWTLGVLQASTFFVNDGIHEDPRPWCRLPSWEFQDTVASWSSPSY